MCESGVILGHCGSRKQKGVASRSKLNIIASYCEVVSLNGSRRGGISIIVSCCDVQRSSIVSPLPMLHAALLIEPAGGEGEDVVQLWQRYITFLYISSSLASKCALNGLF